MHIPEKFLLQTTTNYIKGSIDCSVIYWSLDTNCSGLKGWRRKSVPITHFVAFITVVMPHVISIAVISICKCDTGNKVKQQVLILTWIWLVKLKLLVIGFVLNGKNCLLAKGVLVSGKYIIQARAH